MATMIIRGRGRLSDGFAFFWVKNVKGFNRHEHCAKCLTGSYEPRFHINTPKSVAISLTGGDGDIVYVCGVSKPFVWRNNFHLAIRIGEGQVKRKLYTGETLEIVGGFELPFDHKAARAQFPDYPASYLTCRNFQFAAQYFGNQVKPPGDQDTPVQMRLF